MRFTLQRLSLEQADELAGMGRGVVDSAEENVLIGDPPPRGIGYRRAAAITSAIG
jgi:hypothetical protein